MRLHIRCVLTMVANLKMVASSFFLNNLLLRPDMLVAGVSLLPGTMYGCLGYKNGFPALIDDTHYLSLVISPQDK